MSDLDEQLRHLCADFKDQGLIISWAQIVVMHEGRTVADVAFGEDHLGRPLASETASCTYCVSKVPLFAAVLAAIEDRKIGLDSRLSEVLTDANPFVGSLTLTELLAQRGGTNALLGPLSRFVPSQMRRISHQWMQESPRHPRGTQCYSVSEVGWLAALILERLSGQHYADLVPQLMTDLFGEQVHPQLSGEVAISFQPTEDGSAVVPLLNETARAVRSQWNPALGWYSSATGVALVGHGLNDAWHGRTRLSADLVRHATSPMGPMVFDPGLDREASFGLGFWTDFSKGAYGAEVSDSTFGHNAQGGTAHLLVDPEKELVIAACFDLAVHEDAKTGIRRHPLVRTITEAIDG